MSAKAIARYVRLGPRKVSQILNLVRGKTVEQAYQILRFVRKRPTTIVMKTIKSAVSNFGAASRNDEVYIKSAYVTQGPSLKRLRPMAMGRAAMYKRKSCHITIEVEKISIKKTPMVASGSKPASKKTR